MSDKCQCIIPYNDNRIGYCLNKATVRIGDKNLCDQHAPSLSNPPISHEDLEMSDTVTLYRKKPVVIQAVRYAVDSKDEQLALLAFLEGVRWRQDHNGISLLTLEGEMLARPGDWIIKGVKGEVYPCKPHIFEMIYEPADAHPPISREDLETVCKAARHGCSYFDDAAYEAWGPEKERLEKERDVIFAAIARVQEACK